MILKYSSIALSNKLCEVISISVSCLMHASGLLGSSYVLTKASSLAVIDGLSLTRQQWVGSVPLTVGSPSISESRRAAGPSSFCSRPPPHLLTHPFSPLPTSACCAQPPLLYHYDKVTEWLQVGQVFKRREKAQRRRAPRPTDRQRGGGKVCHYASLPGW